MKKTLAQETILLKELQMSGSVSLTDTMEKLGISSATARRLFCRMEEKGYGIRSYGKISLPDSTYSFYSYEASEELYVKEKKAIAKEAASYISDGDTLFLDSGTTVCLFSMALADALRQKTLKNVNVFTNSYMIINILNGLTTVNLIGGTFRPNRKDFCGYIAERTIKDCHFDKCILGTDGYYKSIGFSTTDFESARICEAAIENSDKTIILMDSHKFGKAALVGYSKGDNVSLVISDGKLKKDAQNEFISAGINIHVVNKFD